MLFLWPLDTCRLALFRTTLGSQKLPMRLEMTRKTDYALRAMLCLARECERTLSSVEIAARTGIPVRFVGQVMSHLVRAGLVTAVIGRSGGYRLDRDPARVSVLAIVEAVEGDARRQLCALRNGKCQRSAPCEVHHVFAGARDAYLDALAASSLTTIAAADSASPASSRGASRDTRRPVRGAEG